MKKRGVLLPISSLYGKSGIGSFGKDLANFLNYLKNNGQDFLQICPIGHVGEENSPYICYSAFAGNPLFIDLDLLVNKGVLSSSELDGRDFSEEEVEYERILPYVYSKLESAHSNFVPDEAFFEFCKKESSWLNDYALFMCLKESFNSSWLAWPHEFKYRDQESLKKFSEKNEVRIAFYKFIQYLFFEQWDNIRRFADSIGIQIVGDIPIYLSMEASDVWANPELFQLNDDRTPTHVAGVPPDYFSQTGQLWGNPLYKWEKHKEDDFKWWRSVFTHLTRLYHVTRIDHFRGLEAYWAVPYGEATAINGEWIKAPGRELMEFVQIDHPDMPFIAEDLGVITDEVIALRDDFKLPGMHILQFCLEDEKFNPRSIPSNSVTYTGTHDNDTLLGWLLSLEKPQMLKLLKKYGPTKEKFVDHVIKMALNSKSEMVVIPIQDYLKLSSNARINIPGSFKNIYRWRLKKSDLEGISIKRYKKFFLRF